MGYKPGKKSNETKPSLDLFMILGNILVDKDNSLYEHHIKNELFPSVFSSYMILRYLSMNANISVRNAVLNHLTTLEGLADKPELMYKLLLKIVPKTYNRFTPYIKSGFKPINSSSTTTTKGY
jgi:surface polysaccharide O-acyltransferase-like enzyme